MADLTKETIEELRGLLAKATPGPWHHCQPFMTVPAHCTVHGPIPAERVDYISTWPDKGTPSGHRVVIDMPGRESRVRSEDMALIAAMRNALPALLDLAGEVERLRKGKWAAQHVDTMNDMVAMGLARDDAEARAESAESERDALHAKVGELESERDELLEWKRRKQAGEEDAADREDIW